ncbi:LPXTG cell wall anchor domain-containing protein [Actinospica robiniae]|uniref:LPXTG cell wall anchor domain-containing protein n=1 Tax=Actinospica robiniae TaxID=304901 RepID=UPI000407CB47|nr:LPXTG cell wall anchor domain-containing protein [Actinospica robiniae]
MYDLAKRSLVLTVATGGLLLTGSAFSPAMAAEGLGPAQGPTHAQESADAVSAYQALHAATASGSGEAAAPAVPHGAAQPPDLLFPQASTGDPADAGAPHALDPGTAQGRDPFQVPVDLGRQLCDSVRAEFSAAAAAESACGADTGAGPGAQYPAGPARPDCAGMVTAAHLGQAQADARRSPCVTAEGSAAPLPDASAAGSYGASATAPSPGFGRMPIAVPVSMPMMRSGAPMGCTDEDAPAFGADPQSAAASQTNDPCLPSPEWYPTIPSHHPTCPPPPKCPPTAPPSPVTHSIPPTAPPTMSRLPQTGADIDVALGVAGAALLAGAGLSGAARHRRRDQ